VIHVRYSKLKSCTIIGLNPHLIDVEVDHDKRSIIHDIDIVGLGDTAVKESKKRIKSAVRNSGYDLPTGKMVVNLAPGDLRKEGSLLDLPIALGIMRTVGIIKRDMSKVFAIGELGLDGSVKPVKGVLPILLYLKEKKMFDLKVLIPKGNENEVFMTEGLEIYSVENLIDTITFLNGDTVKEPLKPIEVDSTRREDYELDFSEVKGQLMARRAAEIAAAGMHNLLMKGPPGSGKSMIARRIPTILPPMTEKEMLEVTKIYSVVGLVDEKNPIVTRRPFRSPHHTSSAVSIIGGGNDPKPGEISLAHNGILFLDELPEFRRDVLEALRQPMEDGEVTISRARMSVTYPASFMFVGAQNPCPCGHFGDPKIQCRCTPYDIYRYNKKISGPILDRIDVFVELRSIEYEEYRSRVQSESSREIRMRVMRAWEMQKDRFRKEKVNFNSKMNSKQIRKYCGLTGEAERMFERGVRSFKLSGRGMDKILKLSRTIADLDGVERIDSTHVAEAFQFRHRPMEEILSI